MAAAIGIVAIPLLSTIPSAARWLTRRPGSVYALSATAGIAAVGFILVAGGIVEPRLAAAFAAPLAQLALVGLAFKLFVHTQGREPVDVAFNWSPGLLPDRLFALSVVLLGILPFAWLVAPR